MKRLILLGALFALGGCASLSAITGAAAPRHNEALKALGEHIEGCERHYQGGIGLGANFTFNIDCKAQTSPQN